MFDRLDDTIVAISSPPGIGIRGILRLSGPRAFELAAVIFFADDGCALAQAGGHERHFGHVRVDGSRSLPAQAYTFRSPASYTRQDLIEIHTIGSPPILAMLLEQLIVAGARVAEPGEFTGRAFFAGAIDLTAVEGVASMIHAQTDAQLRASEALLHGAVSRRTRQMREELADLLALVEADIDFSEEAIEFVSPAAARGIIDSVAAQLDQMLSSSQSVERLEVLPRVVLVGLPNAGKSTLFNRLTGMDRAIQSAVAGTTRDVITVPLVLPGGEVILCDTAGMMASNDMLHSSSRNIVLHQAIESATDRAIARADLVLVVIDAVDDPQVTMDRLSDRLKHRTYEVVLNKVDVVQDGSLAGLNRPALSVSAKHGTGIEQLRLRMDEILFAHAEKHGGQLISLTERHRGALHEAGDALLRATELLDAGDGSVSARIELLAMEIRHAMHSLSLLLGEVTTEDLLGRIFSRFCIGK